MWHLHFVELQMNEITKQDKMSKKVFHEQKQKKICERKNCVKERRNELYKDCITEL